MVAARRPLRFLAFWASSSCAFSVAVWGLMRPVPSTRGMFWVEEIGVIGVVTGAAAGVSIAVALLTAASRPER